MFRLTLDIPPAPAASTHATRDAAAAELRHHGAVIGRTLRTVETSWAHTRYRITERQDVIGHAAIDELCACGHTHREHDDIGCTVTTFGNGTMLDCDCRSYAPVCDDPTLFGLEHQLNAPGAT